MACTCSDGNAPTAEVYVSLEQSQPTTESRSSEATAKPEPQYKGDGSKYICIMTDERDRRWEEEIVSFADTFLNYLQGHPKLTERSTYVCYETSFRHPNGAYESLFDTQLRDAFIQRVNRLIASIDSKSDSALLLGYSEIVSILDDAHSNITLPLTEVFPLGLIPIYTGDIPEAYIYAAPQANADLLLCRLDVINGVSVSDIITRTPATTASAHNGRYEHSLFIKSVIATDTTKSP